MRILYIHQYFCPPDGYGNNRSYDLAKYWAAQGHEVHLLTSVAHFPKSHLALANKYHFEIIDGIYVHILNVPYSHFYGFWKRIKAFIYFYYLADSLLKRQLFTIKPDIVYASSTPPTIGELGRKWSQKWNIPLFFETVDVWPDVPEQMGVIKNPWVLKYLHTKVEKIYQHAHTIIALSPGMKNQILTHGVDESKIFVSLNGTDTTLFRPTQKGIIHRPNVLYAGTIGKANQLSSFIYASKELEEDADFLLIGNGNDAVQVQKLIKQLNPTNLTWKTWIAKKEIPPLMASADIGVSVFAPFKVLESNSANKFYDYLACGLPVVLNYEGWQADFLEEYQCGFAAPINNQKAFIDAIATLIQNPNMRASMGSNARKVATKFFDRKHIAQELLDLFHHTR